jgi:NADH-quinone oxidoreductase subunit G
MLGAGSASPLKACLVLNLEPVLDAANATAARSALDAAELVVALTSFKPSAGEVADVVLPIAPFTETSGTFVNAEGRVQSFHGVVKPLGDARPAWKVLRVLGNMLGLEGFDFEASEEVRAQALGDTSALTARLDNRSLSPLQVGAAAGGDERIADVPIYSTDPLVRRAPALQATADAQAPWAGLPSELWAKLGLSNGARVRLSQGMAVAELPARLDASLAPHTVRVPAGHPLTSTLGAMFGPILVEKV